VKRADVIDYELTDEAHSVLHGSVSAGTSVPVLIVAVNDDDSTFSGFAFLPNGQTEYLTAVAQPEAEPEPEPEPETHPETQPEASSVSTAQGYSVSNTSEGSNAQ
jgi:hypothetical protein